MVKCIHCKKKTTNPKFCSRSCAASHNNKSHPKRKLEGSCSKCGKPCEKRRKCCTSCHKSHNMISEEAALGGLRKGGNANFNSHYSNIRKKSRTKYQKSGLPMECAICRYSLHVDVCHIKGINEFSDDDKLKDINAISNLIALCKNHHWELDNDHLDKNLIKLIVERRQESNALSY
jgi:hypothetical protein